MRATISLIVSGSRFLASVEAAAVGTGAGLSFGAPRATPRAPPASSAAEGPYLHQGIGSVGLLLPVNAGTTVMFDVGWVVRLAHGHMTRRTQVQRLVSQLVYMKAHFGNTFKRPVVKHCMRDIQTTARSSKAPT